jgi:hypothetical protein
MRLKVTFKYFTENNDGLPNRKMDWCIVHVENLNRDTYDFIEEKTREYFKKHHRGCMYYGITAVERI